MLVCLISCLLLLFSSTGQADITSQQLNPFQILVSQITPTATQTPVKTPTITATKTPVATQTQTATRTPVVTQTPVPTPVPTLIPALILSPANNQTVSGNVSISIATPPASNWANVYINGTYWISSPPLSFTWNSTTVANGSNTITVMFKPLNWLQTITVNVVNGSTPTSIPITPTPATPVATPIVSIPAVPPNPLPTVVGEVRPQNTTANNTPPTQAQLVIFHSNKFAEVNDPNYLANMNGQFTGTTDQILTYYSLKWFPEFDPNITRAIAVNESNWIQSAAGDGGVSFGILQIKSTDWSFSTPMSRTSTGFNSDFKIGYQRACYDGHIPYLADDKPTAPHPVYTTTTPIAPDLEKLWGCIGDWYSGHWWDAGAITYVNQTQADLAQKPWLKPGF